MKASKIHTGEAIVPIPTPESIPGLLANILILLPCQAQVSHYSLRILNLGNEQTEPLNPN